MRDTSEKVEAALRVFEVSLNPTILGRLECSVWGAPVRLLTAALEALLALLLYFPSFEKLPDILRTAIRHLDQVLTYGRPLGKQLEDKVIFLEAEGIPKYILRDAIVGRVLRADGTSNFREDRRKILCALGFSWHFVVIVSTGLLIALTATLPGSLLMKAVCIVILFFFSGFAAVFMNAVSIRTSETVKLLRRACTRPT